MGKKVLIDVERLKYQKTGLANVCSSLVRGLDQITNIYNYTLFGPNDKIPKTKSQFAIINWRFWKKYLPINTTEFSLIHVTHQSSDYFHKKRSHQKKVVTLHDLNFLHEDLPHKKMKRRLKKVQKNIGNADSIVCISKFVLEDLQKNSNLFTLSSNVKFSVIYNGLNFLEPNVPMDTTPFAFKCGEYILNIGVLSPKKNQIVLLNLLLDNELELVLIANGYKSKYKDEFMDKAMMLKVSDRVHVLEHVSEDEKHYLIQNCQSYCHPSLAEGFGIPPVEAMYYGKPIFLSTFTSLPEIAGSLAFYFDDFSAKSMVNIYKQGMSEYNAKKEYFQNQLKARALEFDYKKMAENYQEVYQRLLG